MSIRVVFMGSPDFSVPTLRALADAFYVTGVISQPDKPRGRGRKPAPTAVKAAAIELGIPVAATRDVSSEEGIELLHKMGARCNRRGRVWKNPSRTDSNTPPNGMRQSPCFTPAPPSRSLSHQRSNPGRRRGSRCVHHPHG